MRKNLKKKMVKAAKKVAIGTTKAVGMAVGVRRFSGTPVFGN